MLICVFKTEFNTSSMQKQNNDTHEQSSGQYNITGFDRHLHIQSFHLFITVFTVCLRNCTSSLALSLSFTLQFSPSPFIRGHIKLNKSMTEPLLSALARTLWLLTLTAKHRDDKVERSTQRYRLALDFLNSLRLKYNVNQDFLHQNRHHLI